MGSWVREDSTAGAEYIRLWRQHTEGGRQYAEDRKAYMKRYRQQNRQAMNAKQKEAYQRVRLEALQHYSGDIPHCGCQGCGETQIELLQFDHLASDGAAHRRSIGMRQGGSDQRQTHQIKVGGNGFSYWLKKNGWPEGIQVLCYVCNKAKGRGMLCPLHPIR